MITLKNTLVAFLDYCYQTLLTSKDGIEEAGVGENYYNSEMWTHDVTKSLILWIDGKELEHSKFLYTVKYKIDLFNLLKEKAKDHKNFLVCEVGRGLDILLTLYCNPDLESIICFDHNPRYEKLLNDFFKDDRIIFKTVNTHNFNLNLVKPETLLIRCQGNTSMQRYLECENIRTAILNGEQKK